LPTILDSFYTTITNDNIGHTILDSFYTTITNDNIGVVGSHKVAGFLHVEVEHCQMISPEALMAKLSGQ